MGLFGGKTELTVETERTRLVVGEEVRARITVGEPDRKVQGGRVRLLYVNTYRYEGRDSDGDRTEMTTRTDVEVAEAPLFAGAAPAAGTYDVILKLPDDAPPTAEGSVAYKLRATLDRKGARDVNEDVELHVLSARDAYADRATRPVEQPSAFQAEIDAAGREARPGDTVSGTVTVTPTEDVEGRGLRARARGIRRDQDGLTKEYDGPAQTLCEPAELVAGQPQTFAFSVQVPADAPPTFEASYNALDWFVEVFVDRRMRKDPTARLPIVVRSA